MGIDKTVSDLIRLCVNPMAQVLLHDHPWDYSAVSLPTQWIED